MYIKNDNGTLSLFKLNRQETMRYFGSLDEEEWNGNLAMRWKWNEKQLPEVRRQLQEQKAANYKANPFLL